MKRIWFCTFFVSAVLLAVAVLLSPPASAVVTSKWQVASYREWNAGDATDAFITSLGELRPGWSTRRTKLELDTPWSLVRAADGRLYLGTADDGAVYRVHKGATKKLTSIAGAIAVVSLAANGNTLYAGTMPGGAIYKIDAVTGRASRLAALSKAETVWALALDRRGKSLYAGTGPNGQLVRVDTRTGKARVVFDSGDKRVQSLVVGADGGVWLGTSDKGIVYRYDPRRGTTRAMVDFDANEITTMIEWRGGVIATVNNIHESSAGALKSRAAVSRAEGKKRPRGHVPGLPRSGSKPGADKASSGARPPRRGARKGKGALFRIHPSGRFEQLHALTSTYYTAVAVDRRGRIFAGAADRGRIYMIGTDDSVSTAFDVSERMVSHILTSAKGVQFITGDTAAHYETTGAARKASYESKVFDTKVSSRYGKLAWRGAGAVTFETRSGNTAEPGKGWSRWAKIARPRIFGGGHTGKIASPHGRYFQFRLRFNGDRRAVVREASFYYLPQNRPTKITAIDIEGSSARTGITLASGATKSRSPILELEWKVHNPDSDKTQYRLAVRREGDVLWRKLNTGPSPLTKSSYKWNTESFPDGYYRLRVSSSDRHSNAASRALEQHKISDLFLIDNAKPRIDAVTVRYPRVSARAADAMSAISEMAYSVDDGPWQLGSTADGIFDDPVELLRFTLPRGLKKGVHSLAIRVADESGNLGSVSVSFRIR